MNVIGTREASTPSVSSLPKHRDPLNRFQRWSGQATSSTIARWSIQINRAYCRGTIGRNVTVVRVVRKHWLSSNLRARFADRTAKAANFVRSRRSKTLRAALCGVADAYCARMVHGHGFRSARCSRSMRLAMNTKTQFWLAGNLATAILCGCANNSTGEMTGSVMPMAGAGAVAAASSGGGAGGMATLPTAEKCPQIPRVQGFQFESCCQSDNMCGVDGSSLNRGCLSYEAIKKFFNFAPPPLTTCDGTPVAAASAAAGSGSSGMAP
jgi:hypothetical protein